MTPRSRRPDASLLLIGLALLAVLVLELTSDGGEPPAGPIAQSADLDVEVPSDSAAQRPPGGGAITAGALGGVSGADDERRDRPAAGERPASVRDGWAGTAADAWERRGVPVVMASVGELELMAPLIDPVVIGFHEASGSTSLDMRPLGPPNGNDNTTRFTPPFEVRLDAQPYLVLASRGRSAGPTTAVDVVARPDAPVVAPVTGHVTDIRAYALYGRYADNRVEIRPNADPTKRVVMVHVSDVAVGVGDRVVAGSSVVAARATAFPFSSQIDRETEPEFFPHVHVEVQPFDAPRPGDES